MIEAAAETHMSSHPDNCLDVNNDFDVVLWEVPSTTISRPDCALHNCAPANVSPLPASYLLLIVEVVSPGSTKVDSVEKLGEYAMAGIPFYWVVRLAENSVASIDVHVLDHMTGSSRFARTLGPEDEVSVVEVPIRIRIDWSALTHLVR